MLLCTNRRKCYPVCCSRGHFKQSCSQRSGLKDLLCSPKENTQIVTVNATAQSQQPRKQTFCPARAVLSDLSLPAARISRTVEKNCFLFFFQNSYNGRVQLVMYKRAHMNLCSFVPLHAGKFVQIKLLSASNEVC